MEGIHPPPRKPRTAAAPNKPVKGKSKPKPRSRIKAEESLKRENSEEMKDEPGQPRPSSYEQAPAEQSTRIKNEPIEDNDQGNVGDMAWMSLEPHRDPEKDLVTPKLEDIEPSSTAAFRAIEEEPRVKTEPVWNWVNVKNLLLFKEIAYFRGF